MLCEGELLILIAITQGKDDVKTKPHRPTYSTRVVIIQELTMYFQIIFFCSEIK